jgi:hypothetical protein
MARRKLGTSCALPFRNPAQATSPILERLSSALSRSTAVERDRFRDSATTLIAYDFRLHSADLPAPCSDGASSVGH